MLASGYADVTLTVNTRPATPIVYRDGFSESAWKSLTVKSLRMGWPEGLRQAVARLSRSSVNALLLCGIFEDTFPAVVEMDGANAEVRALDFEALCARETHHGRGYTDAFCDLEHEAVEAARNEQEAIYAAARGLNLLLPPRSLNCFYTWIRLRPNDTGVRRKLDDALWRGMPKAMLDGHTLEGKWLGQRVGFLSGDYAQHRVIGQRVMREGWDPIRAEAHEEIAEPTGRTRKSLYE
jgi:hypothetical protein